MGSCPVTDIDPCTLPLLETRFSFPDDCQIIGVPLCTRINLTSQKIVDLMFRFNLLNVDLVLLGISVVIYSFNVVLPFFEKFVRSSKILVSCPAFVEMKNQS